MDWKARVAELKKLKRPRSYGPDATQKQIDAYFNKTAEINKIEDKFYDDLLAAVGVIGAEHVFIEVTEKDWFWVSTDGAVGGRIENVICGFCKDTPEMWRVAMDARRDNKEELNTLFLDNATMLQWSDIHCMVRTGVYKKLKV